VDAAVAVDGVMDTKLAMLDKMDSQVYEWLPWHDGYLDSVPAEAKARRKWLKKAWGPRFETYTKRAQKCLKREYGKRLASKVKFAEAFEISEYGRQPSENELAAIFPFACSKRRKKH
jgi:hypothetical protein